MQGLCRGVWGGGGRGVLLAGEVHQTRILLTIMEPVWTPAVPSVAQVATCFYCSVGTQWCRQTFGSPLDAQEKMRKSMFFIFFSSRQEASVSGWQSISPGSSRVTVAGINTNFTNPSKNVITWKSYWVTLKLLKTLHPLHPTQPTLAPPPHAETHDRWTRSLPRLKRKICGFATGIAQPPTKNTTIPKTSKKESSSILNGLEKDGLNRRS